MQSYENMKNYAVMYGKFSDDKEIGIILTDIYYGGIGHTEEEANTIAKKCVDETPGMVITKIIPIRNRCLRKMSKIFKQYFEELADQMYNNENM